MVNELEHVENLTQDDVLDKIIEFPLQPLKNKCIVTVNTFEVDGNSVLAENSLDEVQYVMAVGPYVKDTNLKAGAKVLLDLQAMTKQIRDPESGEVFEQIPIRPVEVDGRVYMMISDSYIDAIDKR